MAPILRILVEKRVFSALRSRLVVFIVIERIRLIVRRLVHTSDTEPVRERVPLAEQPVALGA